MKASEAKDLASRNDKHIKRIRYRIDKLIERRAKAGFRSCELSFDEPHNKTAVMKELRADGYKVGFDYAEDPRDGSCLYSYRISW